MDVLLQRVQVRSDGNANCGGAPTHQRSSTIDGKQQNSKWPAAHPLSTLILPIDIVAHLFAEVSHKLLVVLLYVIAIGLKSFATTYFEQACHCYQRWCFFGGAFVLLAVD